MEKFLKDKAKNSLCTSQEVYVVFSMDNLPRSPAGSGFQCPGLQSCDISKLRMFIEQKQSTK